MTFRRVGVARFLVQSKRSMSRCESRRTVANVRAKLLITTIDQSNSKEHKLELTITICNLDTTTLNPLCKQFLET